MGVCIEQATVADVGELIQLRLAYLTADFGVLSAEDVESIHVELGPYLRFHLGRDLKVFVARDDSIVCTAWLLLVDKPPSPRFPRGRTGVLFNVYTASDRRRQGLARRVMHALIEEARALQLDVLELHATDDGYPLYQSLGFMDDSMTHKAMRMMLGSQKTIE